MNRLGKNFWLYLALILAFSLNTTLPFFATYESDGLTLKPSAISDSQDKILICTAEGFKWISPGRAGGSEHGDNGHIKCPLCYFASHGINAGQQYQPEIIAYNIVRQDVSYRREPEAITGHLLLSSGLNNRAPPVA